MKGKNRRMHKDVTILVAEDDEGHAGLIRKNLARAGIVNKLVSRKFLKVIRLMSFRLSRDPSFYPG